MRGEIKVVVNHNSSEDATAEFKFNQVRPPARGDAAAQAVFKIVDGTRDQNGGTVDVLHDGKAPMEGDQPSANCFFRAGTDGGRVMVDLGKAIEIKQVNTYSWHPGTRSPQVYHLYASDGNAANFNAAPKRDTAPDQCGWKLLAKVDTRPKDGEPGGQYGVSVGDSEGSVGKYRFLLFDMFHTETTDSFGNTFYSEIDVIDRNAPELVEPSLLPEGEKTITFGDGKYTLALNTSETPDLAEWADKELIPLVEQWYPKIVNLLPSEDYEAPRKFSIVFKKDMKGVANTAGTRIHCAAKWVRSNLKGEAKGAIFHEMVHVVQQYGRAKRTNPNATTAPGWLVEGITDYIRFYHFEPQTRGAEIAPGNMAKAKYDGSYRVTANFLNYISEKYGKDLVPRLNAIIRDGNFNESSWNKLTGHSAQELNDEWKAQLGK
ncbi:MAG: basic secretory protein-like protein [Verrucomicrobiota bacterium]